VKCNKDELQQQLVETWREFQQNVVDNATDQWRTRLEACVQADGDHFEQCL